jgi:IS605 OrfB family transposase
MKQIRTVKLQLNVAKEVFQPTIAAYTSAFNYVCKTGWDDQEFNGVNLHKKTYHSAREQFGLPSQLAISSRVKATEALSSVRERQKKGKPVSCPQSRYSSIRYDDRSITVNFATNEINILTIDGRLKLPISIPEYFKQYIGWKRCSPELFQTADGRTFLHIVFETDVSDVTPTGDMIGIDRGIKKIATVSDNRFFGGGRIKHVSQRYERIRSELQSRGTRSAKRHFAKIRQSERLFRKDVNHCIAKQIVSKLHAGMTIVLEKLTGIRGGARKLTREQREAGQKTLRKQQRKEVNKWNFFQFEQFITYKAAARGINVEYVDARYTSRRCSCCGHIKKGNRKSQCQFKCRKCGFQLNADLNASRNIVLKYLDASGYPSTANVNLPNGRLVSANAPIG